jgi:NTP pyrophosphatase (non-canonical NTP hydrolase)
MSLEQVNELIINWVEDRPTLKANNADPLRIADLLQQEVLELNEELVTGNMEAAAIELADVYWFLVSIANLSGIDIEKEVREKAALNTLRYPAYLFQGEITYEEALKQARDKKMRRELNQEFYGD